MPMKKNIKILILGGTGYLGQKLINDLQKNLNTQYIIQTALHLIWRVTP